MLQAAATTLTHAATLDAPEPSFTRGEGVLMKQHRFPRSSWRRLHFEIHGSFLIYYRHPAAGGEVHKGRPHGIMPLGGSAIKSLDTSSGGATCRFMVTHPSRRPWYLGAGTAAERDEWIQALTRAASPIKSDCSFIHNDVAPTALAMEDSIMVYKDCQTILLNPNPIETKPAPRPIPERYEKRVEESLDILMSFGAGDDGWRQLYAKKGVKVYSATYNGVKMFKGKAILNHHPISVLLSGLDANAGPELDPSMEAAERIDVFSPYSYIEYHTYKAMWPVAGRDLVFIGTWRMMPNGDLVYIGLSEEDGVYPEQKGRVRAKSLFCGWIFRALDPAGTKSECIIINGVDAGGSVPQALVDKSNEYLPMRIGKMGELLDNHKKMRTGLYEIDAHRLANGFTEEDVVGYVKALHRRTYEKASTLDWLCDEAGSGSTSTMTEADTVAKPLPAATCTPAVANDVKPSSAAGAMPVNTTASTNTAKPEEESLTRGPSMSQIKRSESVYEDDLGQRLGVPFVVTFVSFFLVASAMLGHVAASVA